MPVLAFLAFVGIALVALLFVADATLERDSPVITSDRVGLPPPWHSGTTQILTTAPAPAPDMTSQAVLAAQPKAKPEALEKIKSAGRHGAGRGAAQSQSHAAKHRLRTKRVGRQIFHQGAIGHAA